MSKISDALIRESETKMEYEMKFMDWMYDTFQPQLLNESDIDDMEKSYCNSSSIKTPSSENHKMISKLALNNPNYNHIKEQVS